MKRILLLIALIICFYNFGMSQKDVSFFEITKVEFANTNKNGKEITPYGEKLYASEMLYLTPKIYYNGKCDKKRDLSLIVKIIKPDGTVLKYSSYGDYTFRSEITIRPGDGKSLKLDSWGSSYTKTYSPGTYGYELWCGGDRIYQTNVTFYKTAAEEQMEREYADKAYMDIKKIEFANVGEGNNFLAYFGATLYASEMRYLAPRIYYNGKCAVEKNVTLNVKIVKPDGTIMKYSSSPEDYSFKKEISIQQGNDKSISFISLGSSSGGVYTPGTYRYELWYEGHRIYQTNVTFYKTAAEEQMEREYADKAYMDIQKVEFGNQNDGKELTPYGGKLYASEMRYLAPKIYYNGKCAGEKKVTLNVKIIKPDGTVSRGTSSPDDYSFKNEISIQAGNEKYIRLSNWGSSSGGVYIPGTYRYELWYEGHKIYQTNVTFYKTEAEEQMEREYANKAYMDIQKVEFANLKKGGKEMIPYGEKLFSSSMRYLSPKIYYTGKCCEEKDVTLYWKIIQPDGSLKTGKSSPDGYTWSYATKINPGNNKTLSLIGYGDADNTIYKSGTYSFELWYQGNKIYETSFTLYKTEEEIQMEKQFASKAFMDIQKVEFANTDNDNVLTSYGSTLYASEMRFLRPKIYYNGKCGETKNVTIYFKIIKPDGTVSRGTSSPDGFSSKCELTIQPGNGKNITGLCGWGSSSGGIYRPGTYRYELWYEGHKIYQTNVTFYKTAAEEQMEREYADKAYMDIQKVEFANTEKGGNEISPYGSTLYASEMRFLKPKVYYTGKCAEEKNVTLYWKIIQPDGSLKSGKSSPEGYSTSDSKTIRAGQGNSLKLSGWGHSEKSIYKGGIYRFELWYQGRKIYETSFTIYGSGTNTQSGNAIASNNSLSSSSRTNQSISNPDLRNLTLADLFPQEKFPIYGTVSAGGATIKTTLYASGLLEMSGSVPCQICNQTGVCGVCAGLKGRIVFYDINYQEFLPCAACGGTGQCNTCKGTGYMEGPKQTYRIDPLQIAFSSSGDVTVETETNGQKKSFSFRTQYKYEICTLCGGTGHMDGSVASFGLDSKWCEQCHKMVPMSHCHGCKQCPKCEGKGFVRKMVY